MLCTLLRRAVFTKNTKFAENVPDNSRISEIPKKSFPRNPGNFPRHFPKFPDFPEIPGFSGNVEIFQNFRNLSEFSTVWYKRSATEILYTRVMLLKLAHNRIYVDLYGVHNYCT
jgi:hypothetical protein